MASGFAFTIPASMVAMTQGGGGSRNVQTKSASAGKLGKKISELPFQKVLKNEARKDSQGASLLGCNATDKPGTGIMRKLENEIQGGAVNIKDLLMFLQQLAQASGIDQTQLKSFLADKVIPALEKGGKDLQELAKLLKQAIASTGKGTPLESERKIKPNPNETTEMLGKKADGSKAFGNPRHVQKVEKMGVVSHEIEKAFKLVKQDKAKEGVNPEPQRLYETGKELEQSSLGGKTAKGMGGAQANAPHSLKDLINSLSDLEKEEGESKSIRKGNLNGVKGVQTSVGPLEKGGQVLASTGNNTVSRAQNAAVVEQIVQKVAVFRHDGHYTMRIALKPPQLGNIDVALTVRGHHLQANFSVESPVTHEILTHQLPELRAQLAQQGLTMKEVSVQVGGGNPQGFRPFGGTTQEFSGRSKGRGLTLSPIEEVREEGAELVRLSKIEETLSRTSLDRINIFA